MNKFVGPEVGPSPSVKHTHANHLESLGSSRKSPTTHRSFVWPTVGVILHHQVVECIEASGDFARCLNAGLLVPHVVGVLVIHQT